MPTRKEEIGGEVLDTNTKASRYEKEKESQEERRPNLQTSASPFAREIFDNEMTDPISTPIADHFFFLGRSGGVGAMPRVYILRRFPFCNCYIGQNHSILISSNHALPCSSAEKEELGVERYGVRRHLAG